MNPDVMFAVHNEHLLQLRNEAAHERLIRSVERANALRHAKATRAPRSVWRSVLEVVRHSVRPA